MSRFLLILLFCSASLSANAQIAMRGEVHKGKVLVRWAPTDARTWKLLNERGVQVERLTIVRDGKVLDQPEAVKVSGLLKPEESEDFKRTAAEYPYAAIIAQAIWGESFAVTGGDIETIIALSDELQQRFAMSLYAADLCFPAALAVGWGLEDYDVKPNERYLYRVLPEAEGVEHGALFVDAGAPDRFPAPLDFAVQFGDGTAMMSWNSRVQQSIYAAYIPERAVEGGAFEPLGTTPITSLDDAEQIWHTDSITNGTTYHYRLLGITPFGTRGALSDTIEGKGQLELRTPPFITRAVPDPVGGVDIEWEFNAENEALAQHFILERSSNDIDWEDYVAVIDKSQRNIHLDTIPSVNYFSVTAKSLTGRRLRSFSALVQPIDTLPPAVPAGLKAIADTTGAVRISWRANRDKGSFGYRVFKAQTADEEFIPLNDIAHSDTVFVDSIALNSLNRGVYYSVAALDERYNQSDRSPGVEVLRPVPPTPPVIVGVDVQNGRNVISWVSGGEPSLTGFNIWRDTTMLATTTESTFEDVKVENGKSYIYKVFSRGEGGLLSEPSPDYKVTAINKSATAAAPAFELKPSAGAVTLSWKSAEATNVQIYKKVGDNSFTLLSDGLTASGTLKDEGVAPGVKYQYMLVVKSNGAPPVSVVKNCAL